MDIQVGSQWLQDTALVTVVEFFVNLWSGSIKTSRLIDIQAASAALVRTTNLGTERKPGVDT